MARACGRGLASPSLTRLCDALRCTEIRGSTSIRRISLVAYAIASNPSSGTSAPARFAASSPRCFAPTTACAGTGTGMTTPVNGSPAREGVVWPARTRTVSSFPFPATTVRSSTRCVAQNGSTRSWPSRTPQTKFPSSTLRRFSDTSHMSASSGKCDRRTENFSLTLRNPANCASRRAKRSCRPPPLAGAQTNTTTSQPLGSSTRTSNWNRASGPTR